MGGGKQLTFGSLFAGIGGFDLGADRAGMKCIWQAEIDRQCNDVRARHWPTVETITDVRDVKSNGLVRPDVICGGFPCQDLSVAGKRSGLAGERSGLWFEFRRIIAEFVPRWVLIENVPGLLSSDEGRDMGTILGALGKLGYGYAYRVLDAQYLRVAQRRRRVFIVGCLGDVRSAAAVLFECESLPWHPAPRRESGARVAHAIAAGAGGSKFGSGRDGQDDFVVGALNAHSKEHGHAMTTQQAAESGHLIARPLKAGGNDRHDESHETYVTHTLRAEGHDASEDGTGRGTQQSPGVQINETVRRLTPRECERLQGFPDDWTRYRADGSEVSDSARYRMLGNAVCVNVAEWIANRIVRQP